jgi:hypothetical protein
MDGGRGGVGLGLGLGRVGAGLASLGPRRRVRRLRLQSQRSSASSLFHTTPTHGGCYYYRPLHAASWPWLRATLIESSRSVSAPRPPVT